MHSRHPYPKIALDFWNGPMDVFISWLRLNIMPEKLFSKEQMEAYQKRQHLIELLDIESSEELVAWLNTVASRLNAYAWSDIHLIWKADDEETGWGIVRHQFQLMDNEDD